MKEVYKKQSLSSKFYNLCINLLHEDEKTASIEIVNNQLKEIDFSRRGFKLKKYGFKKGNLGGMDLYYYNGDINNINKNIIVYVHGGSFYEDIVKYQVKSIREIAEKTNSIVIVPMYKLLPEGNASIMHNEMIQLYQKLLSISNVDINFVGDSAGAGYILSFAMLLKECMLNQPKNIVVLSPWLDLSMTNEALKTDAILDNLCSYEGNKYLGQLWAGDLDITDYKVSSIYGDFSNLGKITLIFGGKGIFKSECFRLIKKLEDNNIDFNYFYYEKEGHDFATLPTKEGKMIIDKIVSILTDFDI